MEENKKTNNKFILGFIVGIVIVLILGGAVLAAKATKDKNLSKEEIKEVVEKFINQDVPEGETPATVNSVEEFNSGLYKLQVGLGTQVVEAYATKDGKKIFPAAIDIQPSDQDQVNQNQQPIEVSKSDKPVVELFVMSYCPYGTQIEKGIIPAVQALGNKIDFKLKFVNYIMHGQDEIDENLREYCIQKEQNDKLLPYMTCFLKSGDWESCLSTAGVNKGKMDNCVASADKQFKISANFKDKSTWMGNYPTFNVDDADNKKYDVQGSPTLVINGTVVNSARDSSSLLSAICGGFNNAPEACSKANLPNSTPAPGFGEGTASSASASADCGT